MYDERESHSSLVLGHQVFVFFGNDGYQNLNSIEILDLAHRQGSCKSKCDPKWEIIGISIAPR